jgi:hypothetical protein
LLRRREILAAASDRRVSVVALAGCPRAGVCVWVCVPDRPGGPIHEARLLYRCGRPEPAIYERAVTRKPVPHDPSCRLSCCLQQSLATKTSPPSHDAVLFLCLLRCLCQRRKPIQDEESKTDESALKPAAKDGNAPRFEIKKWNAVAMWSWDICADTVRRGVGGSFNGCLDEWNDTHEWMADSLSCL